MTARIATPTRWAAPARRPLAGRPRHGHGRMPAPPAGRLARLGAIATLALAAALPAACVPISTGDGPTAAAPSHAPLSSATSATVSTLQAALRPLGLGIAPASRDYVPSEPPELEPAHRVVFQVPLAADPGGGFVVIYEFADAGHAADAGAAFARYLASGFGQTNYPVDTRFALGVQGSTLVFAAWSPRAMADWAGAAPAFAVLSGFGQQIPVIR